MVGLFQRVLKWLIMQVFVTILDVISIRKLRKGAGDANLIDWYLFLWGQRCNLGSTHDYGVHDEVAGGNLIDHMWIGQVMDQSAASKTIDYSTSSPDGICPTWEGIFITGTNRSRARD